jgi:flagellar hook-length control protein FliK
VRTAELVERMQTVIHVANRQGTAAARITMRPAELGGVAVQIRAHDGGITARLTADTAVGAEALAEAGHELRRSLESAGVTVHGLDVQLNGQGTDAREGQGSGSRALAETLGGSDGGGEGAAAEEAETTIEPTRLPLAGALVDVLA